MTGFMGTGKSSVGVKLAQVLGYGYCDLDFSITKRAGKSVNEIFAEDGECRFRDLETELISEMTEIDRQVISTGGGAVIRKENRELLRSIGIVINLVASPEEVFLRIKSDASRPLLKNKMSVETIAEMLQEREPFYADADLRIDTVGKNVEDVVHEITLNLKGMM